MKTLRDELRRAYDRKAVERDTGKISGWKEAEREGFLAVLQEEGKRTLLEVGAGPGRDSLFFQERGFDVTSIDLSPEMVRLCRAKGLKAQVMDLGELQFPAASFDAVYSLNCLLHVPKAELPAVLEEIRRVLRPAGLFYMGVYGGYDFEGIWEEDTYEPQRFFSFYTNEDMEALAGRVFRVRSFRRIPLPDEFKLLFQSLILEKEGV